MKTATWWQRTDRFLRGLTPALISLLLVLASALPWHLPGLTPVTPAFVVMAVFYWTLHRPDRLPYAATFCLGLLQDLITGTPTGMTALILLMVQGAVATQRTFFHNKPFLVVWWGFSLIMPVIGLVSWIAASAMLGAVVPPLPMVIQVALTILLYPLFAALFSRVQALFMETA